MGAYVYRITEDYRHKSSIKGREFENEWLRLEKDGTVTVKGSHGNGYAWDGCSPKFKMKDIYFGTPEAVLNLASGKSTDGKQAFLGVSCGSPGWSKRGILMDIDGHVNVP